MSREQRDLQYNLLISIIMGNSREILEHLARGAYFDRLVRLVVPDEILEFWGEADASGEEMGEVFEFSNPQEQEYLVEQARNIYYDYLRIIILQIECCGATKSDSSLNIEEVGLLIESKFLSDEYYNEVKDIASNLIDNFRNGITDGNSRYIYRAISEIYNFSRFVVYSDDHQYTVLNDNDVIRECAVYVSPPIEMLELSLFDY